ncbi:alpha-L-fucosidase [Neglectibacter caecimuris]|uniref:alpha-L-fucosidase n=1 Tax=Neglectibacter caecimuris TaxID=3093658 RepID=UPI002AC93A4D|nr:alpha-L-fucosidase [Neglectibacter sp. M00184]
MFQFDRAEYEKRMAWYTEARFGMFIHWGLYAIPARGEWVRSTERIPKEEYMKYFEEFDPVDFDPKKWARTAKEAGMKYVVLTAKHHDGFCLFDSQYTEFKSTNTRCGRDLVKEYVEAVRAEGLKVGLYFSLLDWYHEDYPHYHDAHHPMRDDPAYENSGRNFDRYLEYLHNQVREICTNYGKIDVLWFDFSYGEGPDALRGEAWRASELVEMVRTLQPGVIIDNRLEVSGEGFGSLWEGNPTPYHGDFVSPEQIIPPNGLLDKNGNDLVWEACVTMNNNWGYCQNDRFFKPSSMLIKKLVECVSKGGNLLLNVGPDAKGNIPPQSMAILSDIGDWMKLNSKSIYGCGKAGMEKPDMGRITRKGNKLYYHLFENTVGCMPLIGLRREEVKEIRWLATGAEVPIAKGWIYDNYPDIVFADLGPDPVLPDPVDTVLEVTLAE